MLSRLEGVLLKAEAVRSEFTDNGQLRVRHRVALHVFDGDGETKVMRDAKDETDAQTQAQALKQFAKVSLRVATSVYNGRLVVKEVPEVA